MNDLVTVKPQLLADIENKNPEAVFRSYDVRGIYPDQLDPELAYQVTKAYLRLNPCQRFVLAHDMRDSSLPLAKAIIQALNEANVVVDLLGETTTDNLYYTVGAGDYDGGVMITASHNSADFNGLKFVKKGAEAVAMDELKQAFSEIKNEHYYIPKPDLEKVTKKDTTQAFIEHTLKFAEGVKIKPLKIVVDAGNGMAGRMVQELIKRHEGVELIPLYFEPHPDFPHHEANPALEANLIDLQQHVRDTKADLGVAFDGDGDRVFFVDSKGENIAGYYIQALLAEYFLSRNKGNAVVYDIRNTKAVESILRVTGGRGVVSQAGHNNMKKKMRQEDAIFGGESSSSHFYYRDNYYADSGLITCELILKIISETDSSIDKLVQTYRERFHISGEKNFYLKDKAKFKYIIDQLKNEFPDGAFSDFDGFVIDGNDWRFSLRQSNTEPFIRLNVEADSKDILEEKLAAIFNIIQQFAEFTGEVSNLYALQTLHLDKKEKLEFLYSNLHYTWNTFKGNYIDSLYGTDWTRNQSPIDVLRQIDKPVLDKFYEQNRINIENSIRLEQTYLRKETWFEKLTRTDKVLAQLFLKPIAYFSLEFGLVDWLQVYSGGLGILAGDTIKEASDSGLPMVGIGLFYSEGYFYQRFSEDGWQLEDYLHQDFDDYPIETIKDQNGYTLTVDVQLDERVVKVRGWRIKIGRRSLILLDTNFKENPAMEDKMITYHLYGGDQDTRIKQEIVLAVGGYRLLKAAGISPSILHLNEGHSAFTILVQAEDIMKAEGLDFAQALEKSRQNILFTNHTLKQAGNDIFSYELVEKYLGSYAKELGVEFRDIFALGVDPAYAEGKFGMTILGLNNATKVNAVSKIHAEAAKQIWSDHPMVPITNGVHLSTWVAEPIHKILDEFVSERWNEQGATPDWQKLFYIPEGRLWQSHQQTKNLLIHNIKSNCNIDIPENALICGWFRRLTAYKQPEVLTLDLNRLEALVNNTDRPIRFVFGGKAHPQDTNGKELLKEMYQISQEPRFKGKLILIPDYNWRMARYLVSGSDVWINSPIRFQEACGTSGMKAAANGVLQFSTIDGWIDEVKDSGVIWEIHDDLDSNQYYTQLEQQIIPLFWERNQEGVPTGWVNRAKQTMEIALSQYGTDRMLRDYIEILYRPLLKGSKSH